MYQTENIFVGLKGTLLLRNTIVKKEMMHWKRNALLEERTLSSDLDVCQLPLSYCKCDEASNQSRS